MLYAHAYVDVDGCVIATCNVAKSVSTVQALYPEVVLRIDGVPVGLRHTNYGGPYHQHTSGDGTLIEHYTVVERMSDLADVRYAEINARSSELIAEGFQFTGTLSGGEGTATFSLSDENLRFLIGIHPIRVASTPMTLNVIDCNDALTIADATEFEALYAAAFGQIQSIQDAGMLLIDQVRAALGTATTAIELKPLLDAIVDNR